MSPGTRERYRPHSVDLLKNDIRHVVVKLSKTLDRTGRMRNMKERE